MHGNPKDANVLEGTNFPDFLIGTVDDIFDGHFGDDVFDGSGDAAQFDFGAYTFGGADTTKDFGGKVAPFRGPRAGSPGDIAPDHPRNAIAAAKT